ncbi:hypothetical protein LBMAG42_23170 [Deltaproteobacteria bacterium]|nr:hypothetical protein LBMAG42_23170 [Deltaproteobacteria bacterium]
MRLLPFLSLTLFACAPTETTEEEVVDDAIDPEGDEDGDGLTNGEEDELGSEFDDADSDGDGFDDGEEVEDGYSPIWKWSHPFEKGDYLIGGCPVLPDEDYAGPSGVADYDSSVDSYISGDTMHNLAEGGIDGYNQELPLYTMCGNYTVITVSAEWCGPCQAFAAEMAGITETVRKKYPNFTFYEFLYQDNYGENPESNVLKSWSKSYGLDGIPVVAPEDNTAPEVEWVDGTGYIPSTLMVAPDMTVIWSPMDHGDVSNVDDAVSIKGVIKDYEDSL